MENDILKVGFICLFSTVRHVLSNFWIGVYSYLIAFPSVTPKISVIHSGMQEG